MNVGSAECRVLLLLHHAVLSGERALIHARSSSLHYSKTSSRRRQTQGESSEPNNTNCTCYTCVSYYIWHDLQGKKNSSRRIKVVFRLNFNQLNSFFKRRLPLKNCSYILTYWERANICFFIPVRFDLTRWYTTLDIAVESRHLSAAAIKLQNLFFGDAKLPRGRRKLWRKKWLIPLSTKSIRKFRKRFSGGGLIKN